MSRKLVYLSNQDHQLIFSAQLSAFTRQFRKQLAGCRMRIDRASGVVNIMAPIDRVDAVDSVKGALLRESYLKLGCSQVTLYCMGECLWDYNWHESTHTETDQMNTATLERAASAVTTDEISLERAASAMKLSIDELMDLLEQRSVAVILKSRQPWGINSAAAREIAEWNFQQQLVQMGLEADGVMPPVELEAPAPVPVSTPDTPASNGSVASSSPSNVVPIKTDSQPELDDPKFWQLPQGFSPKSNARTPAKVALSNSLLALPFGDRFYMERLTCLLSPRKYPEAKQFLESVSAHYSSKIDWTKAINELKKEWGQNPPSPAA